MPSTSSPSSPRTTTGRGSSRARPTTSGCSRGRSRTLVAALAERFEARGIPLRADPKRLDLPDLPRHAVREGQVAVQDPPGRLVPVARAGSRWIARARRGHGPRERRLLPFRARPDVRRRRACTWPRSPGSTPSGGSSSRSRTVSAPRSRSPGSWRRSARSPSHNELKRIPPGLPADHPMAELFRYKDVVFGRNLSDAEALSPDRSRTSSPTRTTPGCRSSGCWRRSARDGTAAVRSGVLDQPHRLAVAPRRVPGRRAGRLGQPLGGRPPARRRGRPDRRQARGLGDALGARGPDRAHPPRPARRREHVPEPGPDREARDDRRPPLGRSPRPRAGRRLVRARARRVRDRFRQRVRRAARPARRGGRPDPAAARRGAGHARGPLLPDARRDLRAAPRPGPPPDPDRRVRDRPRRCGRRRATRTCGTPTARPSASPRPARSCASAARRSAARSRRSSGP